jgi:hypothetical protein
MNLCLVFLDLFPDLFFLTLVCLLALGVTFFLAISHHLHLVNFHDLEY